MGDKGQPPELGRAFISDSIGTMASGILGTSTVTSYIESASGVAEGGRTGLTAVVAAILFLAALIFAPLIGLVPGFATAPALIIVGALMLLGNREGRFPGLHRSLPSLPDYNRYATDL